MPSKHVKKQNPSGKDAGERNTTGVTNRDAAVTAREDSVGLREGAARVREDAAGLLGVLVEGMPDAFAVVDQSGTIVMVNGQAERLFGYSRDEMLGQSVDILLPERLRSAHRGHRADYFAAPSLRLMGASMDLHAARKDGQEFPVEISLSPIETNTGTLVISAIRDVAAQRAAQRAVEEANHLAVTAREEVVSLREEAAGLREEAVGLRENTSTLREEARRAWEESAQARSALDALMAQMREANERLVVGSVRAYAMTEDAEEANRLKDEFLATVSHELRTPLNAILGWARMLGAKQLPPDREEKGIATIERNALALAHIIDDLLDVSRIVAGTLRLATQPVDPVAVAQAALDVVRPLAVAKNVQLTFSHDLQAIDTVSGDAGRLEQVIWNLLANAVKFTPEGGRIDVFIASSNGHVEIRVVDTGEGISPDFLPHVFKRFRQADGATTRRHTGLGIGLAIVRQLVELHKGTVHAASDGVGRGATFSVRLPVAVDEARAGPAAALGERRIAASTASPMPRLPRLDALRILVVDDDSDGRALTSLVLTQAGASVTAVASVGEALRMLEVERPDVLVSDIGLPDEDGYGLIRQIRQSEAEHGGFLPAVALTGYARAEDRARILEAGFQAHVTKPVEPVELTAAIATMTHHLPGSET
jgi:PAS domain S-box-containing protein